MKDRNIGKALFKKISVKILKLQPTAQILFAVQFKYNQDLSNW